MSTADLERENAAVAEIQRRIDSRGGKVSPEEIRQWRAEAGLPEKGYVATWAIESGKQHKWREVQRKVRRLAMALPGGQRQPMVDAGNVTKVLPEQSVLVDYLHYGIDFGGTKQIEERYGALVLARDREPAWVDLGLAEEIDLLVTKFISLMRSESADAKTEASLRSLLLSCTEQFWAPLESKFPPNTRQVIVSPDGHLHQISFGCLLLKGKFLGEAYPSYATLVTGRDLLLQPGGRPDPSRPIEIWFDPDFDPPDRRSNSSPSLLRLRFDAVPSTARAANDLKTTAGKFGLPPARLHRGLQASETAIGQTDRPLILQVGTHGFCVLPLAKTAATAFPLSTMDLGARVDLMWNRSGLALSGARDALAGWSERDLAPPAIDGVLTAVEAARLRLDSTWLVTLALCDANVGGQVFSEGNLSLKTAFLAAGAQHVLGSLWRLDANYAAEFLQRFYDIALRTGNPVTAFSSTQAAELRRLASANTAAPLCRSVRLAGAWEMTQRTLVPPLQLP